MQDKQSIHHQNPAAPAQALKLVTSAHVWPQALTANGAARRWLGITLRDAVRFVWGGLLQICYTANRVIYKYLIFNIKN